MYGSWQDADSSFKFCLELIPAFFRSTCPLPPSLLLLLPFSSFCYCSCCCSYYCYSLFSFCRLVLLIWCSLTSFVFRYLFCFWCYFLFSWGYCSLYVNWLILLLVAEGSRKLKSSSSISLKWWSLERKLLLVTLLGLQVLARLPKELGLELKVVALPQ